MMPDDPIEQELAELMQGWAEEAAAAEELRQEQFIARREQWRENIREGKKVPSHLKMCAQCVRAVLSLDPSLACPEGRQAHPQIWA